MWFIGVEVEQETSAPPPKKYPGSAPGPDLRLNLSQVKFSHGQPIEKAKYVESKINNDLS